MLRIIDARTGEPLPATSTRRGPARVEAHAVRRDATQLRVLLVADLLVRALELDATPVWSLLTGPEAGADTRADAAALGVRPFEPAREPAPDPAAVARTLHIVREGEPLPDAPTVAVAPVASDDLVLLGSAEPSVVRLALLAHHHHARVALDDAALDDARDTLKRWRRAVANWARQPSRPIPGPVRDRLRGAWEDDLDAPGVLDVLRQVETDPDLPDGARFETYAHTDRFLGLDLVSELGSV
ncbi:hypothetical protein [Streptomyces tagetis]|uniref:Cysteinyl-tRNA synthetase n=1 Tax=Streptomyces tagetis TaxID=2820809 RepID=A0A940XP12_9ACTN|nr:hypothetical protein [Streptomyces sp. RG38]MBQ0830597.1 hypothetical protein [Streptomyces sp. RG38]